MTSAVLALTLLLMGQESLSSARDLYASAAYEDALAVLNRMTPTNRPPDEVAAIDQYRAFCLLALGRTSEAEHAIEAVVNDAPTYQPSSELSPRVRTAFSDVRKRMLPAIIQQEYAVAKAAYDRKEFAAAAADFSRLLDVMADPAAAAAVSQPPLSDLRTLAAGFRDLSVSAATPPPLPVATAPLAVAIAPPTAPAPPPPPHVYTAADPNVVPPLIMHQELPAYQGQPLMNKVGQIEVIIDETGAVETAVMVQGVSSQYDTQAVAATKSWRYRPAMVNGAPVKFRKSITITVKGRS